MLELAGKAGPSQRSSRHVPGLHTASSRDYRKTTEKARKNRRRGRDEWRLARKIASATRARQRETHACGGGDLECKGAPWL